MSDQRDLAILAATKRADAAEARIAELEEGWGADVRELLKARARVAELETELDAKHAKLVEVADKLRATRDEARALVEALVEHLPKCTIAGPWDTRSGDYVLGPGTFDCHAPATKAFRRGAERYCDAHAPPNCPDYPRAPALRAAVAWLGRTT
jgi:uncharacterized coiled-coil protein SlyX